MVSRKLSWESGYVRFIKRRVLRRTEGVEGDQATSFDTPIDKGFVDMIVLLASSPSYLRSFSTPTFFNSDLLNPGRKNSLHPRKATVEMYKEPRTGNSKLFADGAHGELSELHMT